MAMVAALIKLASTLRGPQFAAIPIWQRLRLSQPRDGCFVPYGPRLRYALIMCTLLGGFEGLKLQSPGNPGACGCQTAQSRPVRPL